MAYVYRGFSADTQETTEQKALAASVASKLAPGGGKNYEFTYKVASFAVAQASIAAEAFGKTRAGQTVKETGRAIEAARQFVADAKAGKFKGGSDGVINAAFGASAFFAAAEAALDVAGAPPAARAAMQVGQAVAGCAAGIAASPGWGIVSCALQGVAAAIGAFLGKPEYNEDWQTPRSIFYATQNNYPFIVADAARLAHVLRHYYGLSSFSSRLHEAFGATWTDGCQDRSADDASYCLEEFRWLLEYPARPSTGVETERPLPAQNVRTILQYMSLGKDKLDALINIRDCLAVLAGYRSGLEPPGRGLYRRYEWDHDINANAVANGAFFGRCALATYGQTVTRAAVGDAGDVGGWPKAILPGEWARVNVDWLPFIRVDELINFFAAVTYEELRTGDTGSIDALRYGRTENPVRLLFVRNQLRDGEPPQEGGDEKDRGYSQRCWTNLTRGGSLRADLNDCGHLGDRLFALKGNVSEPLLREAGVIRLMAAFSMLQHLWTWSNDITAARLDPVGAITPTDDPLQIPLDPRQYVDGRLHETEAYVMRSRVAEFRHGEGGNESIVQPATGSAFVSPKLSATGLDSGRTYVPAVAGPLFLAATVARRNALATEAARLAAMAAAEPEQPATQLTAEQLRELRLRMTASLAKVSTTTAKQNVTADFS